MKICFATNNRHKLLEAKSIAGIAFEIVGLDEIACIEELPETQDTLEGNSLQKAEFVFDKYKVPCFADDTGLEVEDLGGAPGVYSARYAGEQRNSDHNMDLLLENLKQKSNRAARFRTVIALVGLEHQPQLFEGMVIGHILAERRGTAGFGYDPVFVPEGYEKTFAEMSLSEKNALSHRAIAIKKLGTYLESRSSPGK